MTWRSFSAEATGDDLQALLLSHAVAPGLRYRSGVKDPRLPVAPSDAVGGRRGIGVNIEGSGCRHGHRPKRLCFLPRSVKKRCEPVEMEFQETSGDAGRGDAMTKFSSLHNHAVQDLTSA